MKRALFRKKTLLACLIVASCLVLSLILGLCGRGVARAEDGESAPLTKAERPIPVHAYKLADNSGYHEAANKKVSASGHPLGGNFINLSVYTESDTSQSAVDEGEISGYKAYGITGNCARIELSYNFGNAQELVKGKTGDGHDYVYSVSDDTYQSVGEFENIGVVGTGALLFQKKTDPLGAWAWQNKDGETKKQLHTFDFTDVVKPSDFSGGDKYVLYTPAGADLGEGIFVKITFAYELKYTETWQEKNWLGIKKTKTNTAYTNMIETAEFYLVQNSGTVLFHNASNFDSVGDEDSSGAISVNDFETILSGDVTLNGFRLDTLGVNAYDITYRRNFGNEQKATDGQFFLEQGRYDFNIKRKIGGALDYTVFVDRREVNDAVVGYFGQSLFTPDSKRVYTTGEYPAYVAGAEWNLNAVDGTVAPVAGRLYKIADGEEYYVDDIVSDYDEYYRAPAKQGEITEAGIYKAEFWGNPKYIKDGEISGDLYHFVFRFEIVEADTPREPSVNEAYLDGLIAFSDMQSKYYAVAMETKGTGKAIFAFSDFGGAYDFAYGIERGKVTLEDGGYRYDGELYSTQKAVLGKIDENSKARVSTRYFDATDPVSYQTADVADDKIAEMDFAEDVIVFSSDAEQSYMQAGTKSINGRKYRYISPETGEVEEGVLEFAFVHIAGFESESVTLTHKETGEVYEILYDVSAEYQLGLKNAPSGIYTVTETNEFGDFATYEVVYVRPGDMTGSVTLGLFRNGRLEDKTFGKGAAAEGNLSGFILRSAQNELDPYGIVKITHGGKTDIYSFDEITDTYFSDGGVYDLVLADRLGNTAEFSVVVSSPVGFANVKLELEQPDENIVTEYRVFVGQEIELPTPTLADELFVFDGWLYDDALITDGKFAPPSVGTHYVWQQLTQKYTYLNFDANGGGEVPRVKAEIGTPVTLPVTERSGWVFGGWQYGGNVYADKYTPTTSSPTFVAVWNYIQPEIELYDGNLYQTLEVNVGDKVPLPFPERTGYTFFGWREQSSDGTNKIYYGQITEFANIKALRLDALWIRDSEVTLDDLSSGTGGRTMIHFVNGELLQGDSLQGAVGATIAMPKPTRAGYVFVGWIWRTTAISGKIFTGDTMTVPESGGEKLMLEALWTARQTSNSAVGAGTVGDIDGGTVDFGKGAVNGALQNKACMSVIMFVTVVLACAAVCRNTKKRMLDGKAFFKRAALEKPVLAAVKTIKVPQKTQKPTYTLVPQRKSKCGKLAYCIKYGIATVCTAALLVGVLSVMSAFGEWGNLGVFRAFAEDREETLQNVVQTDALPDGEAETTVYGGGFETEQKPTKEEIEENFASVTDGLDEFELDLTEEEMFLYSLIMLDLYSLKQIAFTAKAVLPNKDEILGIGYTNYEESFQSDSNNQEIVYFGAGFIALPRQRQITESDIIEGIELKVNYEEDSYVETSNNSYMISYLESYGPCHYVSNDQYVIYSVEATNVNYTSVEASEEVYNAEYGKVYSYDEGRVIFDPDLGKQSDIKATSINTLLDPVIAKNQYNKYIAEQTANGFTVDTMNFVYISYEALDAYYLSDQDESLLGIDVQEFYDMERTVGPNEYYTVDADGNLTKLEFPPQEEEKADWMDRLAGAVLAIGMICVGVLIVATISVISCGAATASAPYIMGAFIGAGMEVFMQTVIQGKKIEDINWLRVGIAAVSGVLSAIPGVGWLGAGLIQGATEAAMTAVDGGSLEDVLKAFTVGFITGVVIHGVGKALSKIKFCFVAGTAVLMASGISKAIETVKPGDYVKSYNEYTGKTENKRVLQTFENETDELVTVTVSDGRQITSTPGHKFFANNKWISAEDLRAGDILVNVNGQKVVVEKIQHELLDSPVKVYNFEVADNHTYFVGEENGIAVHNSGCNSINTTQAAQNEKIFLDFKNLPENTQYAYEFQVDFGKGKSAFYIGKGTNGRVDVSIANKIDEFGGKLVEGSKKLYPCANSVEAFKKEAELMNKYLKDGNYLLNKIASPGFKLSDTKFIEAFRKLMSKSWFYHR